MTSGGLTRLSRPWLLDSLSSWAERAEEFWQDDPGDRLSGWYGTGYNNWGVQTNQKYLGAMAVLGTLGADGARALDRARAALRFSLSSHLSGAGACSDGSSWGHTWISALGIERMMHGVQLLEPQLDATEKADLRRVLISEAEWLLTSPERSGHVGVVGDPWASSGRNAPESNLWNGALLWRTASRYPDHEHAEQWREQARLMMINAVSIPADATDGTVVDGRPVRERFRGANFFPNYALDHHGYLNVGYMVICTSNAAMLHFDLRLAGAQAPEALHRHHAELWRVVRRMIFSDGRLARIGGDSRVRYAYCQDYLLPALLYAADKLGDEHALDLAEAQLALIEREAVHNDNGSYFGDRLANLVHSNPYYYTRLESDRACVMGMAAAYLPEVDRPAPGGTTFAGSVLGGWVEHEHGAVLERGRRRLAAFSWRAHGLGQGMCQPPDDGNLAEWAQNLGGRIRLLGDIGEHGQITSRRLLDHHIAPFDGGFITSGSIVEGAKLSIPEGWSGTDGATSRLAIAALPDDRTVIGLHYCVAGELTVYPLEVEGLRLNVPNDLYNRFRRQLHSAGGELLLESPVGHDVQQQLGSDWANIDNRIGAVGLYGASTLSVNRTRERRGSTPESLYVDRLCYSPAPAGRAVPARGVVLDIGWVVLSDVSAAETEEFAATGVSGVQLPDSSVRSVTVAGADGRSYLFAANFGAESVVLGAEVGVDLATGRAPGTHLSAGRCALIRLP